MEPLQSANPPVNPLSEIVQRNAYDTDKGSSYLSDYARKFEHLRNGPVALLEIGVHRGGSLQMWRDYFSCGTITGFDLNPPATFSDDTGRIRILQCDQANGPALVNAAASVSPSGFDIIIDDASHMGALTAITFKTLFYDHLRPGGFYAIEDWGTGYWDSWPNGGAPRLAPERQFTQEGKRFPSHDLGMPGFIKQLVDECALPDITHPRFGRPSSRKFWIRNIHISSGLVIVEKASA